MIKVFKTLFPISLIVGAGIDIYYKFNIEDGAKGYYVALLGYSYFCFYLAIKLSKKIIKIRNRIIKLSIFVLSWMIPIIFGIYLDKIPDNGLLSTVICLFFLIIFFLAVWLTCYNIYKIRKIILRILGAMVFISLVIWLIWDKVDEKKVVEEKIKNETSDSVFLVQPWQLNSRYKINSIVKFIKVDLDKDGKDELAAITSYDKFENEVFYYAGFYRYNLVSEMWDEFYSEDLNVLNYGLADTSEIENVADFNQKIINVWSTEFTTLENIGDITGDGCPEIVFSSLLQGKYFDNYIIVAQSGKSHYRFKIFGDQNTMAKIVAEDGLLIEKYTDEKNDIKNIYEWDSEKLYFKLIETQKTKLTIPDTPKIDIEIEELVG